MLLRAHPEIMPPGSKKSKKVAAPEDARVSPPELSPGGDGALALFHPITAKWFRAVFAGPTAPLVESRR
jgi:ATP-dependent Lhr-like helicase